MAKLTPSIYADQVWTDQRVRRLRLLVGPRVSGKLLRVWREDSLVVCPLIVIQGLKKDDQRWFNTPRCLPSVVSGPSLKPDVIESTVSEAIPQTGGRISLSITDDSDLLGSLVADAAALADATRRPMASLDSSIMCDIEQLPHWHGQFHEWVDMMNFLARGWTMNTDVFRRNGQIEGLSISVTKHETAQLLTVLRRNKPVVLSSSR